MTRTQDEARSDNVGSRWALLVMGPSGCGKSTIGQSLAAQLSVPFVDADDHHSAESVRKMNAGIALTDDDRQPWLLKLAGLIHAPQTGLVLACSALKAAYRELLAEGPTRLHIAYLQVGESELTRRLTSREGHFAGPDLLASQLAALEAPAPSECYDAELSKEEVCQNILARLAPHLHHRPAFPKREAQ